MSYLFIYVGKKAADKKTKKADNADKRRAATSDFDKSNSEQNINVIN